MFITGDFMLVENSGIVHVPSAPADRFLKDQDEVMISSGIGRPTIDLAVPDRLFGRFHRR